MVGTKNTTKRQSYPMGWKSNHGPAGTGNKSNVSGKSASERESEDDALPASRLGELDRRGSGIFVTNEFSIERNELQKQETDTRSCDQDGDTNTAVSVNEEKPGGKSPFYHV
ncbi:uncharacterized protein J4E78_004310 [Alternaria triticimaculans]|uniref:uncharacterized protein n=1 Tax=Alternaria triticimaculans TaxID=297637 RepID=UPI0020C49B53|nr:uncharacterized protein J4E78_004310 [Alternaria triticimaculans]KAI4663891.1 hypothetical protein J4E78_004310 [Alternaria triticimaculans]